MPKQVDYRVLAYPPKHRNVRKMYEYMVLGDQGAYVLEPEFTVHLKTKDGDEYWLPWMTNRGSAATLEQTKSMTQYRYIDNVSNSPRGMLVTYLKRVEKALQLTDPSDVLSIDLLGDTNRYAKVLLHQGTLDRPGRRKPDITEPDGIVKEEDPPLPEAVVKEEPPRSRTARTRDPSAIENYLNEGAGPAPPPQQEPAATAAATAIPQESAAIPPQEEPLDATNAAIMTRARVVLNYYESRTPSDPGISVNLNTLKQLVVAPEQTRNYQQITQIVTFLERFLPKEALNTTPGDASIPEEAEQQEQQAVEGVQAEQEKVQEEEEKLDKQTVDIKKDNVKVDEVQTTLTAEADVHIDEDSQVRFTVPLDRHEKAPYKTTFGAVKLPGAGILTYNCEIDPGTNHYDFFKNI